MLTCGVGKMPTQDSKRFRRRAKHEFIEVLVRYLVGYVSKEAFFRCDARRTARFHRMACGANAIMDAKWSIPRSQGGDLHAPFADLTERTAEPRALEKPRCASIRGNDKYAFFGSWHRQFSLVGHQQRNRCIPRQRARYAAEAELAPARMTMASHHDEIRFERTRVVHERDLRWPPHAVNIPVPMARNSVMAIGALLTAGLKNIAAGTL